MKADPRVAFTEQAREDLLGIWDHIRSDRSEIVADRVLTRIMRGCDVLIDHPELGRARPDIDAEARMLVIDRWLALYRVTEAGIQIVRVVDGVRDLRSIRFIGRE